MGAVLGQRAKEECLMWSHVIAAAVGIWLMIAPTLLGFEGTPAEISHRIAGPLIATFSIIAWWQVLRAVRMTSAVAGAWLVIAPIVLGHPAAAAWNSVLSGLAVVGFSLIRGKVTTRYGGGWRALFSSGET